MDTYDTFRLIVHILLIILIVLGSLLTLLVIYVTKQYQTPSGLLIGNLALTDLLVGGFLLPFGIRPLLDQGWTSGRHLCVLNGFTNQYLCTVAILTLTAISFDRYVAIIHGMRYHQIMTPKLVRLLIVTLWVFGLVLAIFPLLGWGGYIYQHGASLCATDFKTDKTFTFFIFIVVFGVPVNMIFFIYSRIFMAVRKQVKAIRSNSIHPTNEKREDVDNEVQPANQATSRMANKNEVQPANQETRRLSNENEVQLANQATSKLANKYEVQAANQEKSRLANENEVQAANQETRRLSNENEVQPANQETSRLASKNEVQLTNQGTIELTNENEVQPTNQKGNQLTNENTYDSTNQSAPQRNDTALHPSTGLTNEAFLNKYQEGSHTISVTNQNTSLQSSTNQSKAYTANQKEEHKQTKTGTKSLRKKLKNETKAALTMFAIIGVFVLSLTPYTIYSLYCLHTGESYETADFITSKIAYSNAIFNPLIYGLMNKHFRKGFHQVFHMIFRCKKSSIDSEWRFSARSSFSK